MGSIEIRGSFDFSKVKDAPRRAATEGALELAMEHIRGIAASRTPVETSRLVGSAKVQPVDLDKLEVALTYDGPYARYQHFELQLHHENGRSLYLESALTDGGPEAIAIVADGVKRAL